MIKLIILLGVVFTIVCYSCLVVAGRCDKY
nr:MAG TPA: hypothetical protein [Caudoviricetes sp.]